MNAFMTHQPLHRRRHRRFAAGFTLLEMAVVLVIIGVVMSAVSVGNDVMRNAKDRKAFSSFIAAWQDAFSQYVRVTGRLPGDSVNTPANRVNGDPANRTPFLCGPREIGSLTWRFLEAGIRLPQGNGPNGEHRYTYTDSVGSPHTLEVCFVTTPWSVATTTGSTGNVYQPRERHVMRISGLTRELAQQMDVLVDSAVSARFGQFRECHIDSVNNPLPDSPHVSVLNSWVPIGWGSLSTTVGTGAEDAARTLVTACLEMY